MRKFLYYRNGIQISAVDALDERGNLKDGVTQRTPLMLRDSAAAMHHRVTDAGGVDPTAGNRPGRVAASVGPFFAQEVRADHDNFIIADNNNYRKVDTSYPPF
jgi:hypothetical protein